MGQFDANDHEPSDVLNLNAVSQFNVGPMIGHTTATGFRLWGRGPDDSATGVARVFNAGTGEFVDEKFFPFLKCYDFVGIVDFGVLDNSSADQSPLIPATVYRFEMGFVKGDGADNLKRRLANGETLNWHGLTGDVHKGCLRTFPKTTIDESVETRFILGSCRDPKGTTGELTFGTILKRISNGAEPRTDMILMTGDQIYMDRSLRVCPESL